MVTGPGMIRPLATSWDSHTTENRVRKGIPLDLTDGSKPNSCIPASSRRDMGRLPFVRHGAPGHRRPHGPAPPLVGAGADDAGLPWHRGQHDDHLLRIGLQARGTAVNHVPGDGPVLVTAGTGVRTSGLILAAG